MKKVLAVGLCIVMTLMFVACTSEVDYEYVCGKYTCDSCHGDGKLDCNVCKKTGMRDGERCPTCRGLREFNSCAFCDNSGKRDATFKEYKDGTREFMHYE